MSKNFDWEVYLLNYPDLVDLSTQQDAFLHYSQVGTFQNRTDYVPEIFDWEKYLQTYSHLTLLNTARDAYIHFMKFAMKCASEWPVQKPLHMLMSSEYNTIIEYNNSLLIDYTPPKPFVLPAQPSFVSVPKPRQTQVPNLFNPLKAPLKNPRSQVAPVKQTTTTAQFRPHRVPTDPKRTPQAPSHYQPFNKPQQVLQRKPIVEPTKVEAKRPAPRVPTEPKRASHAPSQFQPFNKPQNILQRKSIVEPTPPPKVEPKRPAEFVPSKFQPIRNPRHNTKSFFASKTFNPNAYISPYAKKPKVRAPQPGELVLNERPSVYFNKIGVIINPVNYLN
jgi:hypothetical protein